MRDRYETSSKYVSLFIMASQNFAVRRRTFGGRNRWSTDMMSL